MILQSFFLILSGHLTIPSSKYNHFKLKADLLYDMLIFQCETIIEDNEDVFTTVLSKENPNPVDEICVDNTSLCSQALRDEL